jgi:hypothetical protein
MAAPPSTCMNSGLLDCEAIHMRNVLTPDRVVTSVERDDRPDSDARLSVRYFFSASVRLPSRDGEASPAGEVKCLPTAATVRRESARRPRATYGGGSPDYLYDNFERQRP